MTSSAREQRRRNFQAEHLGSGQVDDEVELVGCSTGMSAEIVRLYRLPLDTPARNTQARYNVCPTDPIDVVTERDGKRDCVSMRWGLVPFWWSKPLKELRLATFNARAEAVTEKPFFGMPRSSCLPRARR